MDRPTIKATITVMFQEEEHDTTQGEPPEYPRTNVMEKHHSTQGEPPACKRRQSHTDEGTVEQTRDNQEQATGREREKDDTGAMQAEKEYLNAYNFRIIEECLVTPNDS